MSVAYEESWSIQTSFAGVTLWAVLATLAGSGHLPFGIIELLFIFAVLVVMPLGLELERVLGKAHDTTLDGAVRLAQPLAAILTVISFCVRPGPMAAAMSASWVVVCAMAVGSAARTLRHRGNLSLSDVYAQIARLDLAVGAVALFVSRAGVDPRPFAEPIPLLTAIHFHYSGFGAALIAAATLEFADRQGWPTKLLRSLTTLLVLLPFALAAGFLVSPALKVTAAVVLSLSLVAFAAILLRFSFRFISPTARRLLLMASSMVFLGMLLALVHALGDYLGRPWLAIAQMANSHGVVNGLGFVLLTMLGWLTELHTAPTRRRQSRDREARVVDKSAGALGASGMTGLPIRGQRSPWSKSINFTAREFYDL